MFFLIKVSFTVYIANLCYFYLQETFARVPWSLLDIVFLTGTVMVHYTK